MRKISYFLSLLLVFVLVGCKSTEQLNSSNQYFYSGNGKPDKEQMCLHGDGEKKHAAINNKCSDAWRRGDYRAAFNEWKVHAERGSIAAHYNLGMAYFIGKGVSMDLRKAAEMMKIAARQDNQSRCCFFQSRAQAALAAMYGNGKGVPQDFVLAHMWGNIAASNGNELGLEARDLARKELTASQFQQAQELARNFIKSARSADNPDTDAPKAGTGSGFFVSKLGHVITNQHVVGDCKKLSVGDTPNTQVATEVLETDKRNDLALLKISSLKMTSVETKSLIQKLSAKKLGVEIVPLATDGLMRSEDVELGEDVLVAGYPYGEVFSNTIKVTKGIVSANKGLGDDSGQFQMDAAVQPGNSGGPIYDENGNIVGVVVAQLNKMKFAKHSGSIPENVNFGIKASTVRQFLSSSGLPTKWSQKSKPMSTRELAKIAKRQTVMVMCHR